MTHPTTHANTPTVPPRLEGYDCVRHLGSGTTADVYLYQQRVPNRYVAVKVSKRTIDPRDSARFRTEANILGGLSSHPYILSIYQSGFTSTGQTYMALEYAPNGSYETLLKTHRLGADQMLDLGIKLASALYTAHRHGIVHRDIKPANVLITSQGQPVLADFGVATSVYKTADSTGYSPAWAAPEVLVRHGGGDEWSDIFSLGATLFGTLTGSSPYKYGHDTRGKSMTEVAAQEIKPLNMPDVPPEVERALRKALARNPAERYRNALEFARAMQRAQYQCYGHATPVVAEGTPQYPNHLIDRRAVPQAAAAGVPGRRWGVPVAIAAGVVALIATIALVFAFVVLPGMDSSATDHRAHVDSPGATGGDGSDESPDSSLTEGAAVPSPENLTGSYGQDGTVTFTWTNPSPEDGDTYAWSPVQGDSAATSTDARIVDGTTLTLPGADGTQTCIQVSIVRADRRMSAEPAIACAAKR